MGRPHSRQDAYMASTISSPVTQPTDRLAPGKWLLRVRAIWFVLIAILFVTFLVSIPATFRMLTTTCEMRPIAPHGRSEARWRHWQGITSPYTAW